MSAKKPTLRDLRAKAELTLLELATKAGCDPSTVHKHERAGTWPARPGIRRRLRAALGLTPEAQP